MKIQKFNELYEQKPKDNWGSDTDEKNYYTFTCDITIRANSEEEAEDKMEFIANGNPDVELGVYHLNYATENGESRMVGKENKKDSDKMVHFALESKKYRKPITGKK